VIMVKTICFVLSMIAVETKFRFESTSEFNQVKRNTWGLFF
jgi:hypothetical protein